MKVPNFENGQVLRDFIIDNNLEDMLRDLILEDRKFTQRLFQSEVIRTGRLADGVLGQWELYTGDPLPRMTKRNIFPDWESDNSLDRRMLVRRKLFSEHTLIVDFNLSCSVCIHELLPTDFSPSNLEYLVYMSRVNIGQERFAPVFEQYARRVRGGEKLWVTRLLPTRYLACSHLTVNALPQLLVDIEDYLTVETTELEQSLGITNFPAHGPFSPDIDAMILTER